METAGTVGAIVTPNWQEKGRQAARVNLRDRFWNQSCSSTRAQGMPMDGAVSGGLTPAPPETGIDFTRPDMHVFDWVGKGHWQVSGGYLGRATIHMAKELRQKRARNLSRTALDGLFPKAAIDRVISDSTD